LKAVFFDMTLAIDTYSAAQHKALEDSEARFARGATRCQRWNLGLACRSDRLYVSERWASMLDLNRDSIGESSASWFGRVHPDDLPDFRQAIDAHIKGRHLLSITSTASAKTTVAIFGYWCEGSPKSRQQASYAWLVHSRISVHARTLSSGSIMPPTMIR
jgi:hypothetical protein